MARSFPAGGCRGIRGFIYFFGENRPMASLVGRAVELAALDAAVERLLGGAGGQVVAIGGEPGIGKSRLLAELGARAAGCLVLGAAASEFEQDLPYAVWTEALDGHLAGLEPRRRSR